MSYTRRTFLSTAVGVVGLGALAGCQGSSPEESADTAQASFFVFGDIASEVAGDAASTGLLVPIGQHGHGWEPGPRVREDIYNTNLFVHGMPGFQPWVDDSTSSTSSAGTMVANSPSRCASAVRWTTDASNCSSPRVRSKVAVASSTT